jgi:DNA mismatch repair protein MutS
MAGSLGKENLTPAMKQWQRFKSEHPDKLILFRMGDFYEIFGEDAILAAPALEIVLTTRDRDKENPLPMCGVPFHSIEIYLQKLMKSGFKAVIVDQVEDPKKAKGIVKRDVTRILTPGTLLEEGLVERDERIIIACYLEESEESAIAYADLSSGEVRSGSGEKNLVNDILKALNPKELLLKEGFNPDLPGIFTTTLNESYFDIRKSTDKICSYYSLPSSLPGVPASDAVKRVLGALLRYLDEQKSSPLDFPRLEEWSRKLIIDEATRRNLELVANLEDGSKEGTLLKALDSAMTPMAKRLLEEVILSPPSDMEEIIQRQLEVKSWLLNTGNLKAFRKLLVNFPDWARINARFGASIATPRDAGALRDVLLRLKDIIACVSDVAGTPSLKAGKIPVFHELKEYLEKALVDNPPPHGRDGGVFRKGFSKELDEFKELSGNAHDAIIRLEKREREQSGIPSLKIKYNKVFGYFIEITRTHLEKVPDYYERKQTLVNAERFVTKEIRELEVKILSAKEEALALEEKFWTQLCSNVVKELSLLREAARILAGLDLYSSFSYSVLDRDYIIPEVTSDTIVEIEEGKHPVLERDPRHQPFVPNPALLDDKDNQLIILTGPNMGGKSTYLRQIALLTIMAHIGSGIPAKRAKIGVVDRVFCRVGASDNLRRGLSTFMVEMTESSAILRNATPKSLVLLDEIGRGTSTFDGLAIAWAIAEALLKNIGIGCRTLFATHYHELTDLARKSDGAHNLTMGVREQGGKVYFLRTVEEGSADKSYGIHVSELAGIPRSVVLRAKEVLKELEKRSPKALEQQSSSRQPTLFDHDENLEMIRDKLADIDIDELTPLDALNLIAELKKSI